MRGAQAKWPRTPPKHCCDAGKDAKDPGVDVGGAVSLPGEVQEELVDEILVRVRFLRARFEDVIPANESRTFFRPQEARETDPIT